MKKYWHSHLESPVTTFVSVFIASFLVEVGSYLEGIKSFNEISEPKIVLIAIVTTAFKFALQQMLILLGFKKIK